MANYKRKKPRTKSRKVYDRWKAKKLGQEWRWLNSWPRWWDVIYHRRPHRRKAMVITKAVLAGKIEAENASWPLSKKPHRYYW